MSLENRLVLSLEKSFWVKNKDQKMRASTSANYNETRGIEQIELFDGIICTFLDVVLLYLIFTHYKTINLVFT